MADDRITPTLPPAASSPARDADWYVIHAGKELGPLSLVELLEKAVVGEIEPDDLVREAGGLWTKARDFGFLQPILLKGPGRGASQEAPAKASRGAQGEISSAAWVMVTIGAIFFLVRHGLDLLTSPSLFLAGCCIWGLFFGLPAYYFCRKRDRTGVTVVAALFLVAVGLDVAAVVYTGAVYNYHAQQPEGLFRESKPGAQVRPSKETQPYLDRGNALLGKGEYDQAIQAFGEAIRLDPDCAEAYERRGVAWEGKGVVWEEKQDYDRAIRDYDDAIRIDPKDARYYSARGGAWFQKQDYDRAIRDYDEAIRLDPRKAWTYTCRGHAWSEKQDYDRAIRDYDEAIRLDPKDACAYMCRGNAWSEKQDYDRAIRDYDEAIRLDPDCAPAYSGRRLAWQAKGWLRR